MRILYITNDKKSACILQEGLTAHGFTVEICEAADEGLQKATTSPYSAVLLDIAPPVQKSHVLIRELRDTPSAAPVITITSNVDVSDRVISLNCGADDCMIKPISLEELVARLRAVMRRHSGEYLIVHRVGDLTVNMKNRIVSRRERKITLTMREFQICALLVRCSPKVVSRTQVLEQVWNYNFDPGTNAVDVYILRLRRKIDDGEDVKLLQTVRGMGYRIAAR
jgi:DNA-binding response OmpR family regulator